MPYVEQSKRPDLDKIVNNIVENNMFDKSGELKLGYMIDVLEYLISESIIDLKGSLNYILFKFCKYHIKPSYNNYKIYIAVLEHYAEHLRKIIIKLNAKEYKTLHAIGELRETAAEIRRRLLTPYEDEKIKTNGDV